MSKPASITEQLRDLQKAVDGGSSPEEVWKTFSSLVKPASPQVPTNADELSQLIAAAIKAENAREMGRVNRLEEQDPLGTLLPPRRLGGVTPVRTLSHFEGFERYISSTRPTLWQAMCKTLGGPTQKFRARAGMSCDWSRLSKEPVQSFADIKSGRKTIAFVGDGIALGTHHNRDIAVIVEIKKATSASKARGTYVGEIGHGTNCELSISLFDIGAGQACRLVRPALFSRSELESQRDSNYSVGSLDPLVIARSLKAEYEKRETIFPPANIVSLAQKFDREIARQARIGLHGVASATSSSPQPTSPTGMWNLLPLGGLPGDEIFKQVVGSLPLAGDAARIAKDFLPALQAAAELGRKWQGFEYVTWSANVDEHGFWGKSRN